VVASRAAETGNAAGFGHPPAAAIAGAPQRVRISVIVLNWNGQHLLEPCLQSLRWQTGQDVEVIVVDNGSTDGSPAFVRSRFPDVRLVELTENVGFAAGNNRGVEVARGENILFLNNDTEVHPEMVSALLRAIETAPPEVGAWAVRMMRWDNRRVIDNCGCGYSAFGSGFTLNAGKPEADGIAETDALFGPSGGAGCYRKAVLDDIGLFDEEFFYNNEDVDLSFRHQLAGYRCVFVPDAVVYHRGSATGGASSDLTVYHIQRNKEWVYFKNMPTRLLWKYLPLHLVYGLAWIAYWSSRGKAGVVLRAKWDALRGWRSVRGKRRDIQSARRRSWQEIEALIDRCHVLGWRQSELIRSLFAFRSRRS
jgi:GT2 family glycosyltransferase